ncbi:hypothetical protein EVAR_6442_1 [Eumeta japonica]|uniref:Uncharacterized protein n=1 Tax=Eumeta variegata TaxID=151549 RepID=A0A4C1SSJ2_EUMVA|nr:hypothetical protein EVAR_6442_1 [Eumeta japonica]
MKGKRVDAGRSEVMVGEDEFDLIPYNSTNVRSTQLYCAVKPFRVTFRRETYGTRAPGPGPFASRRRITAERRFHRGLIARNISRLRDLYRFSRDPPLKNIMAPPAELAYSPPPLHCDGGNCL